MFLLSPGFLGFAGGGMVFGAVVSYCIVFPEVVKWQVKTQVRLKKGTDMRKFWEKLPQPMDFNIYIFNITNFREINAGAKPILQEIGPFHYDLFRDKKKIVDRDREDSVEYSVKSFWYFNEAKSVMSEYAEIYTFHPIILALVLITVKDRPDALGVVDEAIDSIFDKPESVFFKTTVKELFFEGLRINCDVDDFAGSAVCNELEDQEDILVKESESVYRYGFLAKSNGTFAPERIKVLRGIRDYRDVGKVIMVGNKTEMDTWPGNPCNSFRGTDGTVFAPFLTEKSVVWAHSPDICRSIGSYYVEPGEVQGFTTMRFEADMGDPSKDPDVRCLCLEPEGCMPKNLFNADPCMKVPIRLSLPHFYDTDPKYLELVEGLNPDKDKHRMIFDFDPMTGTPIRAHKKAQFNVLVGPVPKLKLMSGFPEVLLPLFWIEEGLELGKILILPLKLAYRMIAIAKIMMYMGFGTGVLTLLFAVYRYFKTRNQTKSAKKSDEDEEEDTKSCSQDSEMDFLEQHFQKPTIYTMQPATVPPNID